MKTSIKISCQRENLSKVRDFVRNWLGAQQVADKLNNQIVLAVDETCANCMIHHHQCDGRSMLEIRLSRKKDEIIIEVKDSGVAFPLHNYTSLPVPELISRRHKGGMGLYLVRRIMDQIAVEQHDGYYIYRLAKKISHTESNGQTNA